MEQQLKAEQAMFSIFQIHDAMGYDGFIHHFKNYVLRQDHAYGTDAREDVEVALKELDNLKTMFPNEKEIVAALIAIQLTIEEYVNKLEIAEELIKSNANITSKQIDVLVKVDDRSAAQALKIIEAYIKTMNINTISASENAFGEAKRYFNLKIYFLFPVVLAFVVLVVVINRLEKSYLHAEEANRAKSKFLANISHDLRTPLHGILSFANFGIKRIDVVDKGKLVEYFSNIHRSGKRLLLLLNDLLDLSKLESGMMTLSIEEVDIYQLVDHCLKENEQLLNHNQISINVVVLHTPLLIKVDALRVSQVISNILSNAIKFSPKAGEIHVQLDKIGKSGVSCSITDSGQGIPESELETIFDTFTQSSLTHTATGGTGLGLAICREIIELHHGKIWAENNPHGGSKITFTLPDNS